MSKNKGIYFQTVIMNKRCVEKLLKLVTTLSFYLVRTGKPAIFWMDLAVLMFRPGIVAFFRMDLFLMFRPGIVAFLDGLGLFQCVSSTKSVVEIDYSTNLIETVRGFCELSLEKVLLCR